MKNECSTKFSALNNNLRKVLNDDNVCSYPNNLKQFSPYMPSPIQPSKEKHIPGYNFCGPVSIFI